MTWQSEFPQFPASAMPTIPEGFTDRSWHNDACPCFIHEGSGLILWIDWPYTDLRSWDGGRYLLERAVNRDNVAGWQLDNDVQPVTSSDSWNDILAHVAAE